MHKSAKHQITLSLLLTLSSACGLIKVNGKPLGGGGGGTSPAPTTASTTESSSSESGSRRSETTEEWEAREKRENDEVVRKNEAIRAGRPKFCDEYGISDHTTESLDRFQDLNDVSAGRIADVMCATSAGTGTNLPELRAKALEVRPRWMKAHGYDEQDFMALVAQDHRSGWEGQRFGDLGGPVAEIEGESALRLDRQGDRVSMLARVGYFKDCQTGSSVNSLGTKIICTREPLDAAKAMAEIDGTPKMNPGTRLRLRGLVRDTMADYTKKRAEVDALAKQDPGVAKLVAIAEAQRKEWAAPSPTRVKLLATLAAMEAATEANKRSAFAGCEATTMAAWVEALKGVKVPEADNEHIFGAASAAVLRSPDAYLAYRALELCAEGSDAPLSRSNVSLTGDRVLRGPRTATPYAWAAASAEIKFDSRDLDLRSVVGPIGFGGATGGVRRGTIQTITPKGTGTLGIVFKRDIEQRKDCVKWKYTNRIATIIGGQISYEQVCVARGMVSYDASPDPVTISSSLGKGLKPGMFLTVSTSVTDAFPILATAGSSSEKAIWLFGVPLAN